MGTELEEALKVLGIPADSDRERVTEAYRRLARVTHPDISADPDAAERFAAATDAYRLVSALARSGPRSAGAPAVHGIPHTRRRPMPPGAGEADDLAGHGGTASASTDPAGASLLIAVSPPLGARPGGRPPIVAGPVLVRPGPRRAGDGER